MGLSVCLLPGRVNWLKTNYKPKIVIDTPASQIIDANQNPAMLVMSLAMEKAMEKATK